MITLKASDFTQNTIRVFNSWISNGHWAVRKSFVSNWRLFETEETIRSAFPALCKAPGKRSKRREIYINVDATDQSIDRLFTCPELQRYRLTPICVTTESGELVRLAESESGELDRRYLKYEYLERLNDGPIKPGVVVFGDKEHPFSNAAEFDHATWILMPFARDVDDRVQAFLVSQRLRQN